MKVVLGLGCDRYTSLKTIETAVGQALDLAGLQYQNVQALASIDKKSDEAGLLEFARVHALKLNFFSAEQLCEVEVPNPSEVVMKYVGTPAVAEAAAMLLAGRGMESLILEKHKYRGKDDKNATVSIVRI